MGFTKYSPSRKRSDRAIVAISRRRVQLNSICQKQYFKDHNFAELYFDKEKKIIGIKPLKKETTDSIIIRRYTDRGIAVIAATDFIREFKIDELVVFEGAERSEFRRRERTIQIPADWDKENNMVIIKLG